MTDERFKSAAALSYSIESLSHMTLSRRTFLKALAVAPLITMLPSDPVLAALAPAELFGKDIVDGIREGLTTSPGRIVQWGDATLEISTLIKPWDAIDWLIYDRSEVDAFLDTLGNDRIPYWV